MDEVVQRFRHGQGLARLDRDARALQRSDDLEGVERVSAGGLVHFGEKRARECDPEVVMYDEVQRTRVERTDVDNPDTSHRKRTRELDEQRAPQGGTPRQKDADALRPEPPRRVPERGGGGRIKPLDVVNAHEQRCSLGESS